MPAASMLPKLERSSLRSEPSTKAMSDGSDRSGMVIWTERFSKSAMGVPAVIGPSPRMVPNAPPTSTGSTSLAEPPRVTLSRLPRLPMLSMISPRSTRLGSASSVGSSRSIVSNTLAGPELVALVSFPSSTPIEMKPKRAVASMSLAVMPAVAVRLALRRKSQSSSLGVPSIRSSKSMPMMVSSLTVPLTVASVLNARSARPSRLTLALRLRGVLAMDSSSTRR